VKKWGLFLDRDGVINEHLPGYRQTWASFHFLPGFLDQVAWVAKKFDPIVIVTNQQGIGKGLMTMTDLEAIHSRMLNEIQQHGGRIDKIYVCPHVESENCDCRKPKTGMGIMAKRDFPLIDFHRSLMIGDSENDMVFGRNLEMKTMLFCKLDWACIQERLSHVIL